MSQTGWLSTQRCYALARVCRMWDLARSTVYLRQARPMTPTEPPQKRGPKTKWTDAELVENVVERFIRSLNEQLLWVRTFETVEELRLALLEFHERDNRAWLCERHGHQAPADLVGRERGVALGASADRQPPSCRRT